MIVAILVLINHGEVFKTGKFRRLCPQREVIFIVEAAVGPVVISRECGRLHRILVGGRGARRRREDIIGSEIESADSVQRLGW